MISRTLLALLLCGSCIFSVSAHAQDTDVDQADTLDFGAFHKDKKEAVKVWEKSPDTPTKAYTDTSATTKPVSTSQPAATTAAAASTTAAAVAAVAAPSAANSALSGKRYEIRERYTLTQSTKTPYSAFYVIEPLYKQAAQLCMRGWKKLSERSEPIEQDFYLYYNIECL